MQIQALNSIKRLLKTLIKAKCYELLGTEDQYGVGKSFCLKRNKTQQQFVRISGHLQS